jgi:hypothetical protein
MLQMIRPLKQTKQTLWPESVSKLYRPSDRPLSAKLVPTFAVSVMDPYLIWPLPEQNKSLPTVGVPQRQVKWRNGSKPVGYLGQAVLRRGQYDK